MKTQSGSCVWFRILMICMLSLLVYSPFIDEKKHQALHIFTWMFILFIFQLMALVNYMKWIMIPMWSLYLYNYHIIFFYTLYFYILLYFFIHIILPQPQLAAYCLCCPWTLFFNRESRKNTICLWSSRYDTLIAWFYFIFLLLFSISRCEIFCPSEKHSTHLLLLSTGTFLPINPAPLRW